MNILSPFNRQNCLCKLLSYSPGNSIVFASALLAVFAAPRAGSAGQNRMITYSLANIILTAYFLSLHIRNLFPLIFQRSKILYGMIALMQIFTRHLRSKINLYFFSSINLFTGISLNNALSVTSLLNWAVRNGAETESIMNSVERYFHLFSFIFIYFFIW